MNTKITFQEKVALTRLKFPVPESRVVSQLGIARLKIVDARNKVLKRGEHWDKAGPAIYYTQEATQIVTKYFVPKDIDVEFKEPESKKAVVIRANFPNTKRRLVRNGTGEPFIAFVRNAAEYSPGMTVEYKQEVGEAIPRIVGVRPKVQPPRSYRFIEKHYG